MSVSATCQKMSWGTFDMCGYHGYHTTDQPSFIIGIVDDHKLLYRRRRPYDLVHDDYNVSLTKYLVSVVPLTP